MRKGPTVRPGIRRALLPLLLLVAASSSACEKFSPAAPPPNFVLIVVDSLRTDRFGSPGGDAAPTPNVERFGNRAVWFTNAYATTSWTVPSVVSILASQHVSRHKVILWGSKFPEESVSLVEVLKDAGYRTRGWTANLLVNRRNGFAQGYDEYDFVPGPGWENGPPKDKVVESAPASELSSRFLAWLRDDDEAGISDPFFVYLHYMDTHTPYPCPPEEGAACRRERMALTRRLMDGKWKFSSDELARLNRLYDAGVESVGSALDGLLGELSRGGWLDNTWVIITADHGEMLGEHGQFVHGHTLYDHVTRVPLLFIGPGVEGSSVTEPISLVDLAPTILNLAGIERPETFHGKSLGRAILAGNADPYPVPTELFHTNPEDPHASKHRLAIRNGGEKILISQDGTAVRFDLERDPDEQHPSRVSSAGLADYLGPSAKLVDLGLKPIAGAEPLSPEAREELKALGYVQ